MQNQSLPCFLKKYKTTTTKTITQCHTLKNWCFWIVVLKKTLEGTLDSKEIKPVDPKGNQHWIFIERTDSESPILWPLGAKSWLIGKKTLMLGKIKSRRRRGQQKVRWLGGINRHEFEQTPEESEGQGSLVCCSPRGGSDTTEQLSTA